MPLSVVYVVPFTVAPVILTVMLVTEVQCIQVFIRTRHLAKKDGGHVQSSQQPSGSSLGN